MRKTQAKIAERFGISQQTVSYVLLQRGIRHKATLQERNRAICENRRPNAEIAAEHGLSIRQIQRIRNAE